MLKNSAMHLIEFFSIPIPNNSLTALTQGSNMAQDFFVEFKQLVATAGLQITEPSVIKMAL